jgi:hypothetical protein
MYYYIVWGEKDKKEQEIFRNKMLIIECTVILYNTNKNASL